MKKFLSIVLIICFSYSFALAGPWGTDGGVSEGTDILSTGETGGIKVLTEDGSGGASWETAAGGAHTQNTDTDLGTLGTKAVPVDADKVVHRDSASSDALVTSTWTQVKAFLKTYFDTLYGTGDGDALTTDPLSQFAATSSAQLAGVISDATGTGVAVFGTSPVISTPTGIVKGDVGLGNVDNTSDTTKNAAAATLTNKTLTAPIVDEIQITPGSAPSHSEALIYYDSTKNALIVYNDEAEVSQEIGREGYIRVYNDSGSDILDGKVCYLSGHNGTEFQVDLADCGSAVTSQGTIGFATHTIEDGTYGYLTRWGTIHGQNTTGLTNPNVIFLSTLGTVTETPPESPNYLVRVGEVGVVDGSVGTIEVNISIGTNTQGVIKIFNGAVLEDTATEVTSNGTLVTLSYQKKPTGDLSLFFNGVFESFDSTSPVATINLTVGSDISPTLNYVYIPESTKVLTKSTSGFPTTQHVPVATVLVQSASSVLADGVYKLHAWTDHLAGSDEQGHLAHVNHWIRHQHASYFNGVAPTFSGDGTGTIGFASTAGVVLQLHDHTFPAFLDGTDIYAVNDPDTPFRKVTNIADLQKDSTGASLTDKTYALVFWGAVSEATGDCKIFVNLPSGSEGLGKEAQVREDKKKVIDYSIPDEFKGTGFLVYRLVIENDSDTTWDYDFGGNADDLRGQFPNTQAGSSTAVGTEFPDSVFKIQNVLYWITQKKLISTLLVSPQVTPGRLQWPMQMLI